MFEELIKEAEKRAIQPDQPLLTHYWLGYADGLRAAEAKRQEEEEHLRSGAELTPGEPKRCEYNGEGCNECDHYLTCFPDVLACMSMPDP